MKCGSSSSAPDSNRYVVKCDVPPAGVDRFVITAPIIGVGKVFFAFPKADPFLPQIDSRNFHLVLIQNPCNFIRTDSFCIHAEYPAYNLCGFLVDQPVEFILGIFFVAINGDVCGRLARFTFNPNRCALFSAQIPKIPFVEQRLFGKGKDKQAEIQYSCGFAAGWLPKS